WEACKAYLRGEIISYYAYQRKINTEKSICLSRALSDLQTRCVDSPSADLLKESGLNLNGTLGSREYPYCPLCIPIRGGLGLKLSTGAAHFNVPMACPPLIPIHCSLPLSLMLPFQYGRSMGLYLQVRDFIRNRFPSFPAIPPSTWVDTILSINPNLK
ncbi:hypothetical protein F7725_009426, partial [Dissostichus mawsoni]